MTRAVMWSQIIRGQNERYVLQFDCNNLSEIWWPRPGYSSVLGKTLMDSAYFWTRTSIAPLFLTNRFRGKRGNHVWLSDLTHAHGQLAASTCVFKLLYWASMLCLPSSQLVSAGELTLARATEKQPCCQDLLGEG